LKFVFLYALYSVHSPYCMQGMKRFLAICKFANAWHDKESFQRNNQFKIEEIFTNY